MKLLLEIWCSWLFFFVLCAGLVALVEHSPQLPGVRKDRTLESKLANPDPELLKIQGKEWIASEGSAEEWVPPKTAEPTEIPDPESVEPEKKATSLDGEQEEPSVKKEEPVELGVLEKVKEVPAATEKEEDDQ